MGHRVVDIQFYYSLADRGEHAVGCKFRCSCSSQRLETSKHSFS
jgi:hypothetical protein